MAGLGILGVAINGCANRGPDVVHRDDQTGVKPDGKQVPSEPAQTSTKQKKQPAPVSQPKDAIPSPKIVDPEIAPRPHRVYALRPGTNWESGWQRVGEVRVRVFSPSITKVPLVDSDGNEYSSPLPLLALWLEIENLSPSHSREYRRWQPVTEGECVLRNPGGIALPLPVFPLGRRFMWPGEFKQQLPAGGSSVREVLVFSQPAELVDRVYLQLTAERVGEVGTLTFEIPAGVWKK